MDKLSENCDRITCDVDEDDHELIDALSTSGLVPMATVKDDVHDRMKILFEFRMLQGDGVDL